MQGVKRLLRAGPRLISIACVAVLVVVACAASGCDGGGASGTVAFLLPNEKVDVYRTHDRPEFERKVADLCGGCKVVYRNAQGSAARQQKQAEEAMAKGAKAIVVYPVHIEQAIGLVDAAKKRHVPVISYGRLLYNARVDYYVDAEEAGIGKVQGTELAAGLKAAGKPQGPLAVITVGTSGPVNTAAREVFNPSGLKVADERNMSYLLQEAPVGKSEREMRRAIKAIGPNGFGGVYAFDDKAADGVIKVMKSAGIDPADRITTGSGATIPALQRILAGQQYMTVYEANEEVTATAAEMAVEILEDGKVDPPKITDEPANGIRDVPAILLQPTPVTKDTIKKTVIDNGFVDPAQLCTGSYAKYCRELGIEPE